MNLQHLVLTVLKASMALSVLAAGLAESFSDMVFVFRRPSELGRAFLSMNVLTPAIAVAFALMLPLHPAVKIALVTLSVSPVAPFFPLAAFKAGGRRDYTIGLMAVTAILAICFIPIAMKVLEGVFHLPFHTPTSFIVRLLFVTILGPLLAGIAIHSMAPTFAIRIAKPLNLFAMALIILSLLPILFLSRRTMWSLIGDGTLLSLAGLALGGYLIGYLLERPRPENRRVLGLANATRHPAIAAVIAHANFPQQKLVLPSIILYLLVSVVVTHVAVKRIGANRPPADRPPVEPDQRLAA